MATLTSNLPPFKGKVQFSIQNAGSTTSDQIASLNDIIEGKPAAILVDASSAAALNPTLARACAAGIVVVSFDNPVTAPCAYKVSQSMQNGMLVVGQWMNYALKGAGSIFVDRGLPGSSEANIIEDPFLQGLKIGGTHIKVANYYTGQFADGPELQGISADLVGDKNVTGVMTQGYCRPPPPPRSRTPAYPPCLPRPASAITASCWPALKIMPSAPSSPVPGRRPDRPEARPGRVGRQLQAVDGHDGARADAPVHERYARLQADPEPGGPRDRPHRRGQKLLPVARAGAGPPLHSAAVQHHRRAGRLTLLS